MFASSPKTRKRIDNHEKVGRYLTRRYAIALAIIACMSFSFYSLLSQSILNERENETLINLSGRQRMLSQRIALFATLICDTDFRADAAANRETLHNMARQMESAHHVLTLGNAGKGITGKMSAENRQRYFGENGVDTAVKEYLHHVRVLLETPQENLDLTHPSLVMIRKQATNGLLDKLEGVVNQYTADGRKNLEMLANLEKIVLILCIAVLVLEVFFIFRPMVRLMKAVYERMEQINRIKAEFLANISHEIRTPMNAIFGMSELLQESGLNGRQAQLLQSLMNSADGLLVIIDNILDLSRLEAGKVNIDPIMFDLSAAVEDVAEYMAQQYGAKNLDVMVRYMPGTPKFVIGDPGRIRQVLCNLVGNALKFTEGGYVLVTVDRLEEIGNGSAMFGISVEDTGPGIPQEKIRVIFDKFAYADGSSTRLQGGIGIGLAIASKLTELMRGTIHVTSQMGQGSKFWVQLPLGLCTGHATSIPSHTILQGLRVMVVDDIPVNCEILQEICQRAGMEVKVFSAAAPALEALMAARGGGMPYDLVLSDFQMPEMDGETFTRAIKSRPDIAGTMVVILTSAGDIGYAARFQEAGALAFLSKPLRTRQLLDTLALVVQHRGKQGEPLPFITIQTTLALAAGKLEERGRPLQNKHILLVEDNRVNQQVAVDILNKLGCSVKLANNGVEALYMLEAEVFDLVLMDCQMPVMDGFEATQRITHLKSIGKIGDIPVIALTANAMPGDQERCFKVGMQDYLSKPVRKANLEAMLAKWLLPEFSMVDMPSSAANTNLSVEELIMQHSPTPPVSEPGGEAYIDREIYNEFKEMMENNFPAIIRIYVEDTTKYLQQMSSTLAERKFPQVAALAHTIKSSSRQIGLMKMQTLAETIESTLRRQETIPEAEIVAWHAEMEQVFAETVKRLEA